jgi:hypothetical protein
MFGPESEFSYDIASDLPETKSNNVSFVKVEDLALHCRNIVAVSDTYICYSVTQKKNLLRVIDTQSGDKVILRGHDDSVLDLRFAVSDATSLCTVDAGGSNDRCVDASGKPHTFVWRKQSGPQNVWDVAVSLPLLATLVRPHPSRAQRWLVAHAACGKVAVFDAHDAASASACKGYESLPMNVTLAPGEKLIGE